MDFKTALQILNVIFLGVTGAVTGRAINEWRKSREERHNAELAKRDAEAKQREAINERVKATDQHEIEKRDFQVTTLASEIQRLTTSRSELIEGLKQQIVVLESNSSTEVAANLEGLKKIHENRLLIHQQALEECQSELSKYQTDISSKESTIEQLKARGGFTTSAESDVCLQTILTDSQRKILREQRALSGSVLAEQLRGRAFVDLALRFIGHLWGREILKYTMASDQLTAIGDPAVDNLEGLLSEPRKPVKLRAAITLRRMNSEKANELLKRYGL